MKTNQGMFELFIEELATMLDCETQIVEALPNFIKQVSSSELREALNAHLKETQAQVKRIVNIFSILGFTAGAKTCEGMKGILTEGSKVVKGKTKGALLDSIIICCCQKVEHYEIACYGTLRSFAKQIELNKEIVEFLRDSLNEEGAADKKLTKIAEGTLFSEGVNEEAAELVSSGKKR